jgi:hypothetical protein
MGYEMRDMGFVNFTRIASDAEGSGGKEEEKRS